MKSTVIVIIYILITCFLEKSKASFDISTFPNTAVEGDAFSFICSHGNSFLEFRTNDEPVCIIIGYYSNNTCKIAGTPLINYIYSCNSSFYAVTIPGKFINEDLHTSQWECLNPYDNSVGSGKLTLFIIVPIKFVNLSTTPAEEKPSKVIEGQNKQFTCRTDYGRPSSRIQWYLSSVNITPNATNVTHECLTDCSDGKYSTSSHLVYNGNRDDAGKIIYCTAFNIEGYGVRSMNKTIDVLYAPLTHSITQDPPGHVKENTSITLTCKITGGNPLAEITWGCNGLQPAVSTSLPVRNDTSISQIRLNATREINGIVCSCIGAHPVWRENNITSVVFDIQYAPELPSIKQIPNGPVNEGIQVTLTCEIFGGNPLATINWICDEYTDLKPTPIAEKVVSSIELNITRENDGDKCICRGHHPLWTGSMDKEHLLIVYYSPNTSPTIIQTPLGSIDQNSIIILTCEVTGGKPLAIITWQCNTSMPVVPSVSQTPGSSTSSVQLTGYKELNGKYCICFGFHPTWKQNKTDTIELDIKYPPDLFLPITQTPTGPVIEDDMVNLTCEINGGNPVANISWTCNWLITDTPTVSILTNKVVSSIRKKVTRGDNGKNCTCIGQHRLWMPVTQKMSHSMNIFYSSTIQIINKEPINAIENRTKVLMCKEVDGNPRNASFIWYKSNTMIGNTSTFSIGVVNVNDSGNYTCVGSNGFGNQSEAVSEMHVLYSPRVSALFALYGPSIEENGTAILQCTIQSNPSPDIIWIKPDRNSVSHSNGNQFQRNLTIKMANCLDTNNYTCKATNLIDSIYYTTMKDIELFVNCSPRRYDQQESTNIIGLAVGQNLRISEHILAYPIYHITWYFKQNSNSSENEMLSDSNCSTNKIFDHHICFSRQNFTENDFGLYSAVIVNDIGNATISFMVNPQEKPYISTDVNVTCGTLKAEISWMTAYNGGQQQRFYIITTNKDGFHFIHTTGKLGNKKGVKQRFTLPMTAGPFSFALFGNNSFGNATAKGASCEVKGVEENDSVLGLAAGLGSCMAVLLIIIIAAIICFRKRIAKKKGDDTTLFKRSKNTTDENDDDELTDNPLYVTSEIHDDGENGQVYSRVDKSKKRGLEEPVSFKVDLQGPVYSEVKKTGKKAIIGDKHDGSGKKLPRKEKKGKTSTELEMGNVYGNEDSMMQDNNEDGVYANAENTSKSSNKLYIPKKNKDGLIYADLELDNCTSGRKFVIRGLENRTNYAIIDLNVKADPLPSDDDDNEEGNQEQTDNGQHNQDI